MRVNDALLGLVLLALALAVGVYAQTFPAIPGQAYGAAVFPTTIALGLGLCGSVLVLRSRAGLRAGGLVRLAPWARSGHHLRNLAVTVGLVLFYIVASDAVGFIPSAIVVLGTMLLLLGTRPWLALALAVGATLGIHYLFYGWLRVPLPWGVLTGWAW